MSTTPPTTELSSARPAATDPQRQALAPGVDWPERKLQRVRRARRLTGAGGLLLFVSFFLPAVPGCRSPFVPAEQWLKAFDAGLPDLEDVSFLFLYCGAAYLFGFMAILVAVRSRTYRRRTEQSLGLSTSVLLGAVVLLIVSWIGWAALSGQPPSEPLQWFLTLFVLVGLGYWLRSLRMGPAGLLWSRWFMALSCVLWFGCHAIFGQALYGLWISLAGSAVVLVGTTREAGIRGSTDGWGAVWELLRCRLSLHDLDGDRCPECGYLLIGLTSPRCPECGEPFEIARNPEMDKAGPERPGLMSE